MDANQYYCEQNNIELETIGKLVQGALKSKVREEAENPDSTFTPVPATITPAGLELDPDTPATLDDTSIK